MKVLVLIYCALVTASAQIISWTTPAIQFQQQQPTSPSSQYPQHIPIIGPLGVPLEPREVQQAKAAHLDILARQSARAQLETNQERYFSRQYTPNVQPALPVFTQNVATFRITPTVSQAQFRVNSNGILQDTPEVALAKAQHFILYAKQAEAAAKAKDISVENKQVKVNPVPVNVPVYTFQQVYGNGQPQLLRQSRRRRSVGPPHQNFQQPLPVTGKIVVPIGTSEGKLARAHHLIAHHVVRNKHLHHGLPITPVEIWSK